MGKVRPNHSIGNLGNLFTIAVMNRILIEAVFWLFMNFFCILGAA
jgi:hypothetical protein